jgi:hypothetical protein
MRAFNGSILWGFDPKKTYIAEAIPAGECPFGRSSQLTHPEVIISIAFNFATVSNVMESVDKIPSNTTRSSKNVGTMNFWKAKPTIST